MISFAIIVFREMLEMSLILGVLLAATPGLPKRNRWIAIGIGAGILGSLLVAVFSEGVTLLSRRTLRDRFQVESRLPRLDAQTLCCSFACR